MTGKETLQGYPDLPQGPLSVKGGRGPWGTETLPECHRARFQYGLFRLGNLRPRNINHTPKVTEHVRVTFGTGMIANGGEGPVGGVVLPTREPTVASSAQAACLCAGGSHHLQGFMVAWGSLSPRDFPHCSRMEAVRAGCRVQGAEAVVSCYVTSLTLGLLTCAVGIITVTVCLRCALRIQEKHAVTVQQLQPAVSTHWRRFLL